ncbi:Carboxypeptidase O [Cricetulus griseus]|uniref:Carboxypeptidase O n=1 Tax=Cricetulus griseus TaxID=10029 RepID=G3HDK3_CRIGR|nr:Carboxypeptidase O [Cricetulus griseus]
MSQVIEKYAEVVTTQHFLGMTYETWPMYYLKINKPSNSPKKIIWMDWNSCQRMDCPLLFANALGAEECLLFIFKLFDRKYENFVLCVNLIESWQHFRIPAEKL